MNTLLIQDKKIAYRDEGKGKTIVLLHGFTEDLHIWDSFASSLSREYRVIRIDLPGHGGSDTLGPVHSMELVADMVRLVLKKLKAGKCLLVGHSMGGYVTLALAEKHPELLRGICLFHSHPYPDSDEEKANRSRVIAVVDRDKFGFVAQFIPNLFASENRPGFQKEIEQMVNRASAFDKEGIKAALEGMKARVDKTSVLKETRLPVLFILGMKDPKAPVDRFWSMVSLPAHSEMLLLRDCGHMGYLEDRAATLNTLKGFARKVL